MARRRRQDDLIDTEREYEEKVAAKRRRGLTRDYPDSMTRSRKRPKPPLLLRFLAWCGVILFCFVVGYIGTDYIVKKFLDKPWPQLGGDPGSSDVNSTTEVGFSDADAIKLDMQRAAFSVFYPKDGELRSEKVDVISRTFEDNIQEALLSILKLSGMGDAVSVLHVFRDIDTVYLDLSASFPDALNEVGERTGSLLINGIARTMSENFSLTKVRFLVDSKAVSPGTSPVDLTAVWQSQ